MQLGNQEKYKEALKALTTEIMDVEGYDVCDMKLQERRQWITKQKVEFGKIPTDLDKFYEQFELQVDVEEEIRRRREEEDEAEKLAKAKKKKEQKNKKGKGKKKDDGDGADSKYAKVGPNELVRKFDDFYEQYNDKWANN